MLVFSFRGHGRVFGFTRDERGADLPSRYGPWSAFKTIELYHDEPHQGVDVTDCLGDIDTHGFHLTDAHERITHLALERAAVPPRSDGDAPKVRLD